MGGTVGRGKLKWRQLAQSLNEGRFTLVHTEMLKPMIKGTISRRMLSSGISHVAFASVYLEKTRMKKCWIMIIIITRKMVPLRGDRAHSLKLFCMYDKRFEISKTK